MSYQIIDFIEETGQIILYVEGFVPFSVDLPLDEHNNVPTDNELDVYLKGYVPVWQIERNNKLKAGIANADEIRKLVNPLPQETTNIQSQKSMEIENLKATIISVLQEEGLIA